MTTVSLRLPRPHPAQRTILREARRFNVVACGRRFGKTTLGENLLVGPMLEGLPVGWFAPSYKYLADPWRDFEKLLQPVTRHKDKNERRIELVTGGSITFWTLDDPDAGRGRKYKRVVIDEAAKAKALESNWNEAIRPTLTDFKGDAFFLSTPKGRNFFWKAFTWALDPFKPEWKTWSSGPMVGLPTTSNPFIDPLEVEAARQGMPDRVFRQEYLAEFLEESAGVFRGVEKAVDAGRTACELPKKGVWYNTGCDLARVEDFTVLSTLDATLRQVYFDRFNQISWERQIAAIQNVGTRYKGALFLDSTGVGDPIFERAQKLHVNVSPYHLSNSSKNALIDNLAMGIEQGKLRLMDVPEQTAELLAFEYQLSPSRNVILGAPEGMHDDTVIALALAYWGAANPQRLRFL